MIYLAVFMILLIIIVSVSAAAYQNFVEEKENEQAFEEADYFRDYRAFDEPTGMPIDSYPHGKNGRYRDYDNGWNYLWDDDDEEDT